MVVREKVRAAAWGVAVTAALAALIVLGSRNLTHFDAALVGYTFATLFAASEKQGMEGIISKQVKARYVPGRAASWLKIKHGKSDEFIVVGYTAPKRSRGRTART